MNHRILHTSFAILCMVPALTLGSLAVIGSTSAPTKPVASLDGAAPQASFCCGQYAAPPWVHAGASYRTAMLAAAR